jgi:hypothetical protein
MKWFDKWFAKKVHWARSIPQEDRAENDFVTSPNRNRHNSIKASKLATSMDAELESRGVSFNLYSANGGHVVELRNYDEKSDRHKNSLHIIPHDKDLGEALNHIITYEALKR